MRANQTYRIAVDGFDGASGVVYLTYNFAASNIYHLTINTLESGFVTPGSGDYAGGSTILLTAVPNNGYEFVNWEGAVASSANPLSVTVNGDMTLTAHFRAHVFTEGFESGGLTALPWVSTGDQPWIVQTNVVSSGQYAARSGAITGNQSSSLVLTNVTAAGVASFDYKVSSETNFDSLQFDLNGVLQQSWSGEISGFLRSVARFAVPAGTNTFEWRYAKDTVGSLGLDAAFIDNLDLPLIAPSLRLLNPTPTGFQVQFQGSSTQPVRIQASADLASWQTLATTNLAAGAVVQFTDAQAPNYGFRFYRAVSP